MSSCFFSSRLKIRISRRSLSINLRNTALPKLPVPPVINNTLSLNMLITVFFCWFIYLIICLFFLKNEKNKCFSSLLKLKKYITTIYNRENNIPL